MKVVQLFLMVCSLFLSEIITVSHRHTKHLHPFSPASLGSLRTYFGFQVADFGGGVLGMALFLRHVIE